MLNLDWQGHFVLDRGNRFFIRVLGDVDKKAYMDETMWSLRLILDGGLFQRLTSSRYGLTLTNSHSSKEDFINLNHLNSSDFSIKAASSWPRQDSSGSRSALSGSWAEEKHPIHKCTCTRSSWSGSMRCPVSAAYSRTSHWPKTLPLHTETDCCSGWGKVTSESTMTELCNSLLQLRSSCH